MKASARAAGIVFIAITLADVILLAAGNETIPPYIKPFLIPSLAVAAMLSLLPEHKGKLTTHLAVGMAFHTAGDIFLIFSGRHFIFFVMGLVGFLIGHLFYLTIIGKGLGKIKGWKEICALVAPLIITPPVAASFGTGWPMSGALTCYGIALFSVTTASMIWAFRGRRLAWRAAIGGFVFIFSDMLVAANVLSDIDFPFRHAIVMATYLAAEWMLVSTMTRWIQQEDGSQTKAVK